MEEEDSRQQRYIEWREIMTEQDVRRLPENVRPISYRLSLRPDLGSSTFRGEEYVEVQVIEPSDSITLNAAELKLIDAHLMQGMKAFSAKEIKTDEESESRDSALLPGQLFSDAKIQKHCLNPGQIFRKPGDR